MKLDINIELKIYIMSLSVTNIKPWKWIDQAIIYNKKYQQIPSEWFLDNADIIVLLFTSKGVDKDGIIMKFYEIYENIKFVNLPIEVIYVPMDESEEDMQMCFEEQANWFTLKIYDPLVLQMKYMYEVSCVPHIVVIKTDGTIISSHGVLDLEEYGKNAVLTWLSTSASTKNHRRLSKEVSVYGDKWNYMNVGPKTTEKREFQRRYSRPDTEPVVKTAVNVVKM